MKAEYTLPGISQSVVITRMAGRTPVPEKRINPKFRGTSGDHGIILKYRYVREAVRRTGCRRISGRNSGGDRYKATWPEEK